VIDLLAAACQLQIVAYVAGTTSIGEASASSRETSASKPKRQGRYVLGDLLGRGGMAEVFAGHAIGSHGFQKPVAIKRLLPELANDTVFVERLISEAKLLVGMTHGNIVSVLDLAREGEDVFLVMEFVDGPSLRQLMKARAPRILPMGVSTYIVQSAAAGLEFAHARPGGAVIHADISPSNLLLTSSGEVRVADFGIARRENAVTGMVEGKWAYMAPEQARGEALTPRSDVFALGVVLYELVTGQHPIGHQVTPDVRELEQVRIAPPRVVKPSVPVGLDAIIMRALANDPRDRYARMQQLIDALVDERFANAWRESANDLAQIIREANPEVAPEPRTQHTDRPLTIITRSLISSPARMSSPRLGSQSGSEPMSSSAASIAPTPHVATPVPGAPPPMPSLPPELAQAANLFAVPPAVAAPELASVHGGSLHAGAVATPGLLGPLARAYRWPLAVLGLAAVAGVMAAIAIQSSPDALASAPPPARTPAPIVAAVQPTVTPIEEAKPAPAPAPVVAAAPAPAPVAAMPAPAPAPKLAVHRARLAPVMKARAEDSVLRVNTMNGTWAYVRVGSDRGEAPGARFKVASGTYQVHLKNDVDPPRECSVTIGSGQVLTLTVEMEEGACELR
jgi:serine/threonine-protein kinase